MICTLHSASSSPASSHSHRSNPRGHQLVPQGVQHTCSQEGMQNTVDRVAALHTLHLQVSDMLSSYRYVHSLSLLLIPLGRESTTFLQQSQSMKTARLSTHGMHAVNLLAPSPLLHAGSAILCKTGQAPPGLTLRTLSVVAGEQIFSCMHAVEPAECSRTKQGLQPPQLASSGAFPLQQLQQVPAPTCSHGNGQHIVAKRPNEVEHHAAVSPTETSRGR